MCEPKRSLGRSAYINPTGRGQKEGGRKSDARKLGDTWQDLGAAMAIGAGSGFTGCRAAPRFSPLAPKSSRQGNAICESRKVLEGAQERGGGQRQGEDCQRIERRAQGWRQLRTLRGWRFTQSGRWRSPPEAELWAGGDPSVWEMRSETLVVREPRNLDWACPKVS